MSIRVLEHPPDDPAWDRFLASQPTGHHLQSGPWGQLKAKFGWQVIRILALEGNRIVGGAQILTRRLPFWGKIGYISKGPVIVPGHDSVMTALYDTIEQVAQVHRMLVLSIQPPTDEPPYMHPLQARQFKPSSFYVTPSTTVVVNLKQSKDEILAQMKRGTRYNIRLASRKGVVIQEGNQEHLPLFYKWMEATATRDPYIYYNLAYYQEAWQQFASQGMMKLLIAYYEDEPLAGIIVIAFGHWAVYKWGSSSGAHLNRKPNDLLQWAAIRWSKDMSCHYYDLGGISPVVAEALKQGQTLPDCKETNIARFKLGFGDLATFPDSFDNNYGIRPRWLIRKAVSYAWKFDVLRKLARGA